MSCRPGKIGDGLQLRSVTLFRLRVSGFGSSLGRWMGLGIWVRVWGWMGV